MNLKDKINMNKKILIIKNIKNIMMDNNQHLIIFQIIQEEKILINIKNLQDQKVNQEIYIEKILKKIIFLNKEILIYKQIMNMK